MSDVRYALCCKKCGHIEDKAWERETAETHSKRTDRPLTPQSPAPICCQNCGERNWKRLATREDLEKADERARKEARAIELTRTEHFDGLFKIPDEINKLSPEVRRAAANLLGPLEGSVLESAVANIVKVARGGVQCEPIEWIDRFDRAVQRATSNVKQTAKA